MLYQCAVPKGFKAKVPTAPGLGRGLLAAGDFHTCAVAEDGSVACWGCEKGNDRGQCRVPDDLRATAVYVSRHHTCAIRTDGSVVCWGDDAHGQSDAPSDLRAESLTLGEVTTCALESGGGTRCWGRWRRDGVSGGILDRIAESLAPKRRTKPPIPERAGGIALDGTGRVCSTDPHGRLSCGGCPKADDPFCARPFLHPLQASGVSARDGHGLALVPSVPDGWPAAEAAKNLSRGEAAAGRPALPPTKAWLSEAGDFRHASGMRFKTIPTGKFWMGACSLDAARMQENRDRGKAGLDLLKPSCPLGVPEDPDGNDDEGPVHEVYIGTPLQVSVFETTVGDWRKFLAGTGRTPDPEWEENNRRPDHYPAVWISWHDAKSFAEWLNRSKAADDPGFYRLPSETEWEYAARGGARGRYTWGESPGAGLANCMECGAEGTGGTLPAGTFPPNAFGLYEVLGNVDEWVEDCFVPTYEGAPTDGSPRRDGTCAERPARGGSWEYPGASVRLGWRDNYTPDARTDEQGVRIVREIRP